MTKTEPEHITDYWHNRKERVVCDICPRGCSLKEGGRGHCYVRRATPEGIVLDTYGRSGGFAVDPIEKKPLYHFFPGTDILSFGTAGCNLACQFCQNWELTRSKQMDMSMEPVSPRGVAQIARQQKAPSVAFTYNDPVIFFEYAIDTAKACREYGVHPVAVTAAYINEEPAHDFFSVMDAANIDLKAFNNDFYKNYTGAALEPVLRAIQIAHSLGVWIELTTLLIPGLNDDPVELRQMSEWIIENLSDRVPLHFTAYHPDYRLMDAPATPVETLRYARGIALDTGLKHVYTGNVLDQTGSSTFCPSCGSELIKRNGFGVLEYNVGKGGRCTACGAILDGRFVDDPSSVRTGSRPFLRKRI